MNAEFAHDIGAVHAHRIFAESKLGENFFVRLPAYDELQNLKFARTQFAVSTAAWTRIRQLRIEHKFASIGREDWWPTSKAINSRLSN